MSIYRLMQQAAAGRNVGPEGAWDLSYAYFDPPASTPWNLSSASYSGKTLGMTGEVVAASGVFFKPDGTKMYVSDASNQAIVEFDLSTAWDVRTGSDLQSFSTASQDTTPTGVFFKPDGTKMYVIGRSGDAVYEYDLSTAWDISSSSYLQTFSVASQDTTPTGVFFKPDGTKMYVIGQSGDSVYEYDLSIAWDVSTASYLQAFSVAAQDLGSEDIFFKPDGTKMYVVGTAGDFVYEYDLSTPWDISTASYLQNFSVAAQETIVTGVFFKPDGLAFYIVGTSSDSVVQYVLGGFNVSAQESSPSGIFFKPDGKRMYVLGLSADEVHEYAVSTPWDVSTASYIRSFSVAAQEGAPSGLFFKPDGTKMYVVGAMDDEVNEYDLSSAWNISTASHVQNFSVAASTPNGISFKPTGTAMYIVDDSSNSVLEYGLSTAWDISTASYVQSVSVSSQSTNPSGIFLRFDGVKMYIVDADDAEVKEYDLSTAWDISTASYLQNFSVETQEPLPQDFFFKTDGTKMFVIGVADSVFTYTLGPQT